MNFRNKSEIGKRVMTDNQVKAKLYESMSVKSGQREKNRTYTLEIICRFAPTLAYRMPVSRVKTIIVTACAFVTGKRNRNI